jgi:hypothetical protein
VVADDRGDILKTSLAQCDLVMPGNKKQIETLTTALDNGEVDRNDVMRSAERIIKLLLKNTVIPLML